MKKGISFLLITLFSLVSCNNKDNLFDTKLAKEDKYRTYYEIFPRSYADSNNDYIGDLKGIENKLDYISDMGFNGVWLTPINETKTYHGYDVVDYYKINPQFGDIEDLKSLVNKAHQKDINIIIDLVINHSSNKNKWFLDGVNAFKNGDKSNKYSEYYNFSLTKDDIHNYGYAGVYYEANFGSDMPDLNLDSEYVKEEIKNIVKFYFDIGIDGFRLDATTWYFAGNEEKNIEFLRRFNNYCKSINKDSYIVGEAWTNGGSITRMYQSGIDSFFSYYDSKVLGDEFIYEIVNNDGKSFIDTNNYLIEQAGENIPAPFITNHDNARAANILQSKRNNKNTKFGHALMQLSTGTTFTYYGDEIGLFGVNPPDENVRCHMDWGDKTNCIDPSSAEVVENIYGSVIKQKKDSDSILNYIKRINYIRNSSNAIRKGKFNLIEFNDDYVLAFEKIYNNERNVIIINFNDNDAEYDLSKLNLDKLKKYSLVVDNNKNIKFDKNKVRMPSKSILIYK